MELDEYQELTEETAIYPTNERPLYTGSDSGIHPFPPGAVYTTLGLCGETGEVSEKVKKYIREDDDAYLDELERELGDVLWYLARLADELDLSLDEIAESNVEKLLDRYERDAITGSGDDR